MLSYNFANFVCRLHVASCKFLSETKVLYSLMNLRFLVLLTKEGIIEGFRVFNEFIIVFLKRNIFNYSFLFKFSKLISTPGKRQY